ncbi:MAG: glycosyltransferase family 87 protein [Terracidiphilus sp.]
MIKTRRIALFWLMLSCGLAVFWAFSLARTSPYGMADFSGVYHDARCLMQHGDPYKEDETLRALRIYQTAGGGRSRPSDALRQIMALNVYPPTTLLIIAPFATLPLEPAFLLWMFLTACCLLLAAFLMWDSGAKYAPGIAVGLICFVLVNSEVMLANGNAAGIAVGLCVVAVWCFLMERFVPVGILCMAVSLAVKPHDAGLVWLYFLLAGGVYRKRALQTLVVTVVLATAAVLWVSLVAPHWMQELHSILQAASAPGGPSDPGPFSPVNKTGANIIISLQSTVSVFWDDPHIYNPVSYLICGALLLVWSIRTLKARFSPQRAWLALAAVVPLAMLVCYHRPYDAKLLLLSVPACAMLWAEGGLLRWIALLVNSLGLVFTADIPLTILQTLATNTHLSKASLSGQVLTVILVQPAPLILLAMSIFYLWIYVRRASPLDATAGREDIEESPLAFTQA